MGRNKWGAMNLDIYPLLTNLRLVLASKVTQTSSPADEEHASAQEVCSRWYYRVHVLGVHGIALISKSPFALRALSLACSWPPVGSLLTRVEILASQMLNWPHGWSLS